MTSKLSKSTGPPRTDIKDIKRVPEDATTREAIRAAAVQVAAALDHARPWLRDDLQRRGEEVLQRLRLPRAFLGFAMVAINNEFWRPFVEAIPFHRRLFLLPHCLSDRAACTGSYDSVGLHCAGCGRCDIHGLKSEAERFGYSVIVAEGTSSVLMSVLDGEADAVFGVACLDSLERSFQRVVDLGVPHMAVPLLKNGCVNTHMEIGLIRTMLGAEAALSLPLPTTAPRSYVGLLRETGRLFQPPMIAELLGPYVDPTEATTPSKNGCESVQDIALDWLREGGKRLRPFVTLAAYAVAKHDLAVLDSTASLSAKLPLAVRRLALAIEALHKASLVHDDIEDNDDYRYGRPTLHRVYGAAQAVNVGDFLIGLGYRLIAGEMASLGADCTGDIVNGLSRAHMELCRGQGAELQFQTQPRTWYRPQDLMKVAAQKTAPAFELAIYAGLRAAAVQLDSDLLRRFSTYLGEGFQIRNDLDDWQENKHNKRKRGLDVRAGRPTLLRAFAAESEHAERLAQLFQALESAPTEELIDEFHDLYHRSGAFAKVERLYQKLRDRALATAAEFPSHRLRELMGLLARTILQKSTDA